MNLHPYQYPCYNCSQPTAWHRCLPDSNSLDTYYCFDHVPKLTTIKIGKTVRYIRRSDEELPR